MEKSGRRGPGTVDEQETAAKIVATSGRLPAGRCFLPTHTMSSSGSPAFDQFFHECRKALDDGSFVSLVLSRPATGTDVPPRQTLRPVVVRGQRLLQWTIRRGSQDLHENVDPESSLQRIQNAFGRDYRDAHLHVAGVEIAARLSRKGEVRVSRKSSDRVAPDPAHDRRKDRLIPEGAPCPFLEAIGVMSRDGHVRARQHHKFRQINRYLEFVQDIVPDLPPEGTLQVVDFGCGKSGLTFALHHLLTRIHHRAVRVVGLDWNQSVLESCRRIASQLRLEGLEFRAGDIASYASDGPVHLAVSLHACDTATDDALAKAVEWGTDVILAVPCCQHQLAPQVQMPELDALLRHGLLRERFAADATDALRAALLDVAGYRTQGLEFIELEHTPKNLLLRAVRREAKPAPDSLAWKRFVDLRQALGIHTFALEQALARLGLLPDV